MREKRGKGIKRTQGLQNNIHHSFSAQGGSFHIQERYVDIWLLVVGLTAWQVWVSKCKETFSGKRTPQSKRLMMIWFNLISTLQGEFERL